MLELPLDRVHSRSDADDFCRNQFPRKNFVSFYLKIYGGIRMGNFMWSINLPVIWESLDSMLLGVDVDIRVVQRLNVLFIKGADSDYIPDDRTDDIFSFYPKARLVTINNAGHWVHAEQPEIFVSTVLEFLSTV
jgi:pimeloyl-ACP methyl ester carboxylesterase